MFISNKNFTANRNNNAPCETFSVLEKSGFFVQCSLQKSRTDTNIKAKINNARRQNCHKGVTGVYYEKICLKFASHHFLLYVVYMCKKSLNFTYAFKCYHQKCKLALL